MKPLQPAQSLPPKWTTWCAEVLRLSGGKYSIEELQKMYHEEFVAGETWMNDQYVVIAKRSDTGFTHLSIRRTDRKPCRDWRDFQQIKNQLCGAESEGVELYPAESRVVDTSNQYHMWVWPVGSHIRCGWKTRCILGPNELDIPGAVQRPFEKETT